MKQTYIVKPSATPVTVTVDITDPQMVISNNSAVIVPQLVTFSESGYTAPPVVVEPPVVVPPTGTNPIIPTDKKLVWSPDLNKPLPKNSRGEFIDGEFRAGQMTNSTIVTKDGAKALRLAVKATDGNTSNGYRDEVQSPIADNGDMWYEWEQNFEALPTGGDWDGHSWQFHPDNGTGSMVLGLWSEGGHFDIHHNPSGGSSGAVMTPIGARKSITPGKWYKQLLHVKWSAGTDGIIEYWIDDVKYINFKGTVNQTGVYVKYGLNRWLMKKDAVIFYRNFRTYK